jgi:hypothetical protein
MACAKVGAKVVQSKQSLLHTHIEESIDATERRRRQYLEQNREAAKRFGEERNKGSNELEKQPLSLERRYSSLLSELATLKEQCNRLKEGVFLHTHCDNPGIGRWALDQAMRFVKAQVEKIQQETCQEN